MFAKYKSLVATKCSQSNLQKFFHDADVDETCDMVIESLGSSEILNILDDALKSFSTSDKYSNKRQKLARKVFEALRKADLTSKQVDNIANRIIVDFPLYDKNHLTKFVEFFLSSIEEQNDKFMSWKDVLPILLENLQEEKTISYNNSIVSGQDYKINIIRQICDFDWDVKILTPLIKMLGELLVDIKDKAVYEKILKKLISKLVMVDLNEMPPLVHQILKLDFDQKNIKLLTSLSMYFSQHYESLVSEDSMRDQIEVSGTSLKELQDVESTVLYHIYQSAQDNQKSLLEYLKYLRTIINAPENILEPFVMSVLLMVSDIYEDQALQILKMAILRQIQDEDHRSKSAWLQEVSPKSKSFMDIITFIISNSTKDRQLVFKGLVDLAFALLSVERKNISDSELPWEFGKKIIQKVVRKRLDAGATILENLIERIVKGGTNVVQYTDCLAFVCRKLAMVVLDQSERIVRLLTQLLDIPGTAAIQVLVAVLPLMRVSATIRDNLVMVFRKAVYRKGIQSRQMAVLGFLQLLKNLKLSSLTTLSQSESFSCSNLGSSSSILTQATLESQPQRGSTNPWINTSLCREILAILGKCLTHESEVRAHLYLELYRGVCKNSELAEYVIDMLMEHFNKYYIADEEIIVPFDLDKCTTVQGLEVTIQEPIGDLIFILQKTYFKVAEKESLIIEKLSNILESLCKRITKVELESLGIDDGTDLYDLAPKSQQKLLNVKLMISVHEALIAYKIASWSRDSENIGRGVLSLFKGYQRLAEYLKKSSKSKKGDGKKKDKDKDKDSDNSTVKKPGRLTVLKLLNTVLDFDTISKSILILYKKDNSFATEDEVSHLRDRSECQIYILQSCLQLFQTSKSMKDYDYKIFTESNRNNFFSIADTLFKHMVPVLHDYTTFDEQIAILGIECLKETCSLITTVYSNELPTFLKLLCELDPGIGLPLQLEGLVCKLETVIIKCLDQEEENETLINPKIIQHLFDITCKFVDKIVFDGIKMEKTFKWLEDVAKKHELDDPIVVSSILHLILIIEEKTEKNGEILRDIYHDFCCELGSMDKNEETHTKNFKVINEKTVNEAYLVVNKILSAKLVSVNWFLARLNAEYQYASGIVINDEETAKDSVKEKELSLCKQFTYIINVFETLAAVKMTPGPASDAILKNLQKVFTFASALTKYFKKKSTSTNVAFQDVKFVEVIQAAGSALKQAIHELILHIEKNQDGGKSDKSMLQRNKILREVMAIPSLVKAVDLFDKDVLILAKKTNVDLMKYTKSDAIRDFRIKNSELLSNIEKMNVTLTAANPNSQNGKRRSTDDQSDSDVTMNDNDEDSSTTSSKRRKKQTE